MDPKSDRTRQLNLFQQTDAASALRVAPADVSENLRKIAARLPASLYLGASSWAFPGWAGIVYGSSANRQLLSRHGLAAYSRHPLLRAAGVDRTYYRPLPAKTLAGYAAQTPDHFRFVVKAPEVCTLARYPRYPRYGKLAGQPNDLFLDSAFAAEQAVAPFVEGLGAKAGLLLFQFPPQDPQSLGSPGEFAQRLHRFLSALPRGPRYAVELRNSRLLNADYREALRDASAMHCISVHPSMPPPRRQWEAAVDPSDRAVFVRWMLIRGLTYDSARDRHRPFDRLVDEDPETRSHVTDLCLKALAQDQTVFVIANNKAEGSAPLTVFKLAEMIGQRL